MAQRFNPTLSSLLHFDSQYGGHRPMAARDRRCDRMSSISAAAIITIGKQDDRAHFPQVNADFSHGDVEEDTPPSARKFDYVGEAVETANLDTGERIQKTDLKNRGREHIGVVVQNGHPRLQTSVPQQTKSASERVLGGCVLVFVR
eukprot:TRINITY_DN12757_c0_g1_i1.p2 TRINITY_DN12757_c0_g1~~TRINITY_DN12757_c0_g1_i1.p2  ORF type:complete len:146 (+),score=17.13 TRINITY_DN12757_c0_g1_i1:57-494(+)